MLERFFSDDATLQRLSEGPLGPHLGSYAELLFKQGFSRMVARGRLLLAAKLSRWLERRQLRACDLDELLIERFLDKHRRKGRLPAGSFAALLALLQLLRGAGVAAEPRQKTDDSEMGRLLGSFSRHLAQVRGLKPKTIRSHSLRIRRFLCERFGEGPIQLRALRPQDAARSILRCSQRSGRVQAAQMATSLRIFLRFSLQRGECAAGLIGCIPRFSAWRRSDLPKSLPDEQVELLLQSCDRNTATGRRNYAVLLLLARLGLRAGEVAALTLDDIDWEAGEILIKGKSGQDRMPLPWDVGEALAGYLRHGRPRCPSRRVFIRAKAPRRGFAGASAVSEIVSQSLDRAGLSPPCKGAHLLRHSLACRMLRGGASLAEIAEVLRHRCSGSAEVYAKVDVTTLRELAQPWPGGER